MNRTQRSSSPGDLVCGQSKYLEAAMSIVEDGLERGKRALE